MLETCALHEFVCSARMDVRWFHRAHGISASHNAMPTRVYLLPNLLPSAQGNRIPHTIEGCTKDTNILTIAPYPLAQIEHKKCLSRYITADEERTLDFGAPGVLAKLATESVYTLPPDEKLLVLTYVNPTFYTSVMSSAKSAISCISIFVV